MNITSKRVDNTYDIPQVDKITVLEGSIVHDFKDPDLLLTFDGDITADSSGNGFNFTNTGVVAGVGSSPRSNFATFNGSTSELTLTSPTDLNAQIGTSLTFGFWFKTTDSRDYNNRILNIHNDSTNRLGMSLFLENSLNIFSTVGGTTVFLCNISIAYSDDVWRHIVFTINPSGHSIYLNGVLQTPTYDLGDSSAGGFLTCSDANSTQYVIGRRVDFSNLFYAGDLDDFFISGSAYSAADVLDVYNYTVSQKTSLLTVNNELIASTLQETVAVAEVGISRKNTTFQTIGNNQYLVLATNTQIFNSGDIIYSSDVYTLPEAGSYLCTACYSISANSSDTRNIYFLDSNAFQWGFVRCPPVTSGLSTGLSTTAIIYWDGSGGLFTVAAYAGNTSSGTLSLNSAIISIHKLK